MNDTTQQAYRVLARKYRPETFSELIGQDILVRTLSNALKMDCHAFVLTGVRGIGKTRPLEFCKGLNCIGVDGNGVPTLEPCGRANLVRPLPADVMLMFWKWMRPAIQALMMSAKSLRCWLSSSFSTLQNLYH